MIRPGEEWGTPSDAPPDIEVCGNDVVLAQAIAAAPGALIRFRPDAQSDLARAVGLAPDPAPDLSPGLRVVDPEAGERRGGTALALDALAFHDGALACNMCVLGTSPDRLRRLSPAPAVEIILDGRPWFSGPTSTVVIAVGQFLRGLDVVPRGHPGDGRAEVQVYELERRERRQLRTRLPTGAHLPHPRIRQRTAHAIRVRSATALACEIDGAAHPSTQALDVEVIPAAYHLLI